ncbi:unnamed protein product, partial [Ectocarpus sp. 4 AP-2014]
LTFLTFLFRDLGCNFLNASMTSSGSSFSSSHLEHVTIVWSILGKNICSAYCMPYKINQLFDNNGYF